MKILLIGLGSIAKKHIHVIKSIDKNPEFIALRSGFSNENINGIKNIYSIDELTVKVDFCLISNPTSYHYETIKKALALNVTLFIEKPSLMKLEGANDLLKKIEKNNIITYVGYNLRFHPVLNFVKQYIHGKRIIEATVYCGSYLPSWRSVEDYSSQYSAIKEMGGGVHLDLSHEIDYSTWIFGKPGSYSSVTKKISDLKISSFDFANYNLIYPDKAVNITLNYYRKKPKRSIEIVMEDEVIIADLLNQTVRNQKGEIIFQSKIDILETYKLQMLYFYKIIKGKAKSFNSFANSLLTLKICLGNENTG